MTKKDFEFIATILKDEVLSINGEAHIPRDYKSVKRIAERFARELKTKNPRFDSQRFLEACGIKGEW